MFFIYVLYLFFWQIYVLYLYFWQIYVLYLWILGHLCLILITCRAPLHERGGLDVYIAKNPLIGTLFRLNYPANC